MPCMRLRSGFLLSLASISACGDIFRNRDVPESLIRWICTNDEDVASQGISLLQVKGNKASINERLFTIGLLSALQLLSEEIRDQASRILEKMQFYTSVQVTAPSMSVANAIPAEAADQQPFCPMELHPNVLPYAKGCPGLNHASRDACLNGDKPYLNLAEAWIACAKEPECGAILEADKNRFHLRRLYDPDMPVGNNEKSYIFSCPAREEYFARKQKEFQETSKAKQYQVDKTARFKCPMVETSIMPFAKGCPYPGGTTCLNGNKSYDSREAAWLACAEVEDCGVILQMPNKKFFLRRHSDPDLPLETDAYTIEFQCPALDREREQREKEEAEASRTKCPMPYHQYTLPFGKSCPNQGDPDEYSSSCLNGDAAYWTLQEAWLACAETEGCGAILGDHSGRFYLRRLSDPDMPKGGEHTFTVLFDCPALQGMTLKEAEQKDEIEELKTELAEARGQQASPPEAVLKETPALTPTGKPPSALTPLAMAPQRPSPVNQHVERPRPNKFRIALNDTECGWGIEDVCQMENQAYINAGRRIKSNVKREDAMHICGQICTDAGDQCAGFAWKAELQACFFRKNVKCGVVPLAGTDCYVQAAPAMRENEFHVALSNTDCGWGADAACQMDNQSPAAAGQRILEGIKREDAMRVCGQICTNAGGDCGGFAWKAESQACYFRRNAYCGVMPLNGTDCYRKEAVIPY